MPEVNPYELNGMQEFEERLEAEGYSLDAMLEAHHLLRDKWVGSQDEKHWQEYEQFVELVWAFPTEAPDDAVRIYDMFAESEDSGDRLVAAVCLPALMQLTPAHAFNMRTILIEDESEPVRRNAQDAITRARSQGFLSRDVEKLYSGVVVMQQYRKVA